MNVLCASSPYLNILLRIRTSGLISVSSTKSFVSFLGNENERKLDDRSYQADCIFIFTTMQSTCFVCVDSRLLVFFSFLFLFFCFLLGFILRGVVSVLTINQERKKHRPMDIKVFSRSNVSNSTETFIKNKKS